MATKPPTSTPVGVSTPAAGVGGGGKKGGEMGVECDKEGRCQEG